MVVRVISGLWVLLLWLPSLGTAMPLQPDWITIAETDSAPSERADGEGQSKEVATQAAEGRVCAVCEKATGPEGRMHVHRGRQVPVCSEHCGVVFDDDPEAFFASYQPRSALFQERLWQRAKMAGAWFWFGVYVLVGLLCGAVCSYAAIQRGHNPKTWFFAGLVGNLFALLALFIAMPNQVAETYLDGVDPGLNKVPVTHSSLRCGSCGRSNHPAARKCSGCESVLQPKQASEVDMVIGTEAGGRS